MSSIVQVLDYLEGLVTTTLPGVSVERAARSAEILPPDQFPTIVLLFTDLDPEQLTWGQIRRRWEFTGIYFRRDSPPDRDKITEDLEALTGAIRSDPTMGSLVYQSFVEGGIPQTHPDESTSVGAFQVITERVF